MKRERFVRILSIFGIAILFFGLGWFIRDKVGQVYLPLYNILLIVLGLVLLVLSFYPKKK